MHRPPAGNKYNFSHHVRLKEDGAALKYLKQGLHLPRYTLDHILLLNVSLSKRQFFNQFLVKGIKHCQRFKTAFNTYNVNMTIGLFVI